MGAATLRPSARTRRVSMSGQFSAGDSPGEMVNAADTPGPTPAFRRLPHVEHAGRVAEAIPRPTVFGAQPLVERAKEVLAEEFPTLVPQVAIHLPDEKEKRHGQAVAAASLPAL